MKIPLTDYQRAKILELWAARQRAEADFLLYASAITHGASVPQGQVIGIDDDGLEVAPPPVPDGH